MIQAEIVADSRFNDSRITTYVLTYPRFIHSELMTHRQFSRNAASSRAIPIKKMIKTIFKTPAMPVSWGINGKGMQSKKELPKSKQAFAKIIWLLSCYIACTMSWLLSKLGVHKQLSNRLTEPYSHMVTLVTATEFDNFFALRAHPDAQPEFQELAYKMLEAYLASKPKELNAGEWHLPFADKYIPNGLTTEQLLKISTARAARVSYINFEGDISFDKDYKLHDELKKSGHMSPFEHAACAPITNGIDDSGRLVKIDNVLTYFDENLARSNFKTFVQYRKLFGDECRKLSENELTKILESRGKK